MALALPAISGWEVEVFWINICGRIDVWLEGWVGGKRKKRRRTDGVGGDLVRWLERKWLEDCFYIRESGIIGLCWGEILWYGWLDLGGSKTRNGNGSFFDQGA